MRWFSIGFAALSLLACAHLALGDAVRARYDHFVSPAEMRDVVDWIADRHRDRDGGAPVDLRYELARRREWVPGFARRHGAPVYTIGRPFDWLLWQRHELRNANEGRYERGGSGAFEIHYRGELAEGAALVELFDRVAVRWKESSRPLE